MKKLIALMGKIDEAKTAEAMVALDDEVKSFLKDCKSESELNIFHTFLMDRVKNELLECLKQAA